MTQRFPDAQFREIMSNIDICNTLFPRAFPKKSSPHKPQPLKIGVNADLQVALRAAGYEISMKAIRRMLAFWCSRNFYLKTFQKAEHRIDLNGLAAGDLTPEEKAISQQKYTERFEKLKAKEDARLEAIQKASENAS